MSLSTVDDIAKGPIERRSSRSSAPSTADLSDQSIEQIGREEAVDAVQSTIHPSQSSKGRSHKSCWRWLLYTPATARFDPSSPPHFTTSLNILYALAATITVANLYYNQPVLNRIADHFGVAFERASSVATLMQSGYATGLLFVCPLGDVVKRRPFILGLVSATATAVSFVVISLVHWGSRPQRPFALSPLPEAASLASLSAKILVYVRFSDCLWHQWLGLCLTPSFSTFQALSYLCGLTTVTPQLMLPLVGDMAPPQRKGSALSIVVAGLMGGMLVARLLSGVLANYTGWRTVYWVSFALQWILFGALWTFMPDYPSTNPRREEQQPVSEKRSMGKGVVGALVGYASMLWSIVALLFTQPVLAQACAVAFFLSFVFTSFWTTLTFLLASPPFVYPSLTIGLFSLVGLLAISLAPLLGRLILDRFVPLWSALLGQVAALAGILIGTLTGNFTVAGPVVEAVAIDLGALLAQTANRAAIYGIDPKARNRLNTAYMVCAFCGQLTGTAVGNRLYAEGGWRWSGGANIGIVGLSILVCLVRGPREKGWIGWSGGWAIRRDTQV